MTSEPGRWSPEVLAENDFPVLAERQAEAEAQREAAGAESRAEWEALDPAGQESRLSATDAAMDAELNWSEATLGDEELDAEMEL